MRRGVGGAAQGRLMMDPFRRLKGQMALGELRGGEVVGFDVSADECGGGQIGVRLG